jgi:proline racemase
VRFIADGVPRALGGTPVEKAVWFRRHADALRKALVLEPRGHADVTAVALTEATSPGAHAGLLFMDGGGYPRYVPCAVVAAAALCFERRFISTSDPEGTEPVLAFDTPVGQVRARVRAGAATTVALDAGPAFVQTAGAVVQRGARRVPVDIAFGGDFFAIVDSEAAGVPLDRAHLGDLRRVGLELCGEIDRRFSLAHPRLGASQPLAGVALTGPPSTDSAHLRGVVVSSHGVVDRSSLSGSAAVMAVLDAMGLVAEGQPFVHEGTSGLTVQGTLRRRTTLGELPVVELELSAETWVIGEHTWHLLDDDPLRHGVEPS